MIKGWHRGVGPLSCCSLSLVIDIKMELDFVRSLVDSVGLLRNNVLISLVTAITSLGCINCMSLLASSVLNELAFLRRLIRKLRSIVFDRVKAIELFAGLSLLLYSFIICHIFAMFSR